MRGSSAMSAVWVALFFSPLAVGCSAADKKDNGPGTLVTDSGGIQFDVALSEIGLVNAVTITPSNAVVTIDLAASPATAGKQDFKVRVLNDDGSESDATSLSTFSVDPVFGAFAGATFTSVAALPDGKPQVTVFEARVTDKSGTVKIGQGQITLIALRKSGESRDFFFLEPYNGDPSPSRDVLKFSTNIKQVDVAFVTDTTGSMSGVVNNIKTSLSGTIIPALKKAIPNVGIAVSGHDDFPVGSYGSDPDQPYYLLQTVTTDVAKAQAGANAYVIHNGADGPESQYEAIYQTLTGEGVGWGSGSLKKKTNAPGTYGYVDFRPGSLPVVVEITDIEFHDKADYSFATTATPPPHGLEEVTTAYKKTYARHVGISTGSSAYPQQENLCKISGSYVPPAAFKGTCGTGQCCTEASGGGRSPDGPGGTCLMSFKASSSGTGVSDGIVSSIAALSAGSNFDVTAVASNDPSNPNGVDALKFIQGLRAMSEGDASQGCPKATTKDTDGDGVEDTFVGMSVGTPVCFEVIPKKNTTVEATKEPQFYNAFIDVVGVPGGVKLDQRKVLFLVPPRDIIAK